MTFGVNGNNPNQKIDNPAPNNELKPYPGGRLQIKILAKDTQRDFVWRALYEHAKAANLPEEESIKFADQWAVEKLQYQKNGKVLSYTDKEFAALKKKRNDEF